MPNDDQISALERLTKLRDTGVLTQEEFDREKTKVLAGPITHAPFFRRLWFVILMTCLLVTFPVALVILLTGQVFKRSSGKLVPIKGSTRFVYAGVLGLWLVALVVQAALNPQSLKSAWNANSVGGNQTASNGPEAPATPDGCSSSDAADMVKDAIENGATSKLIEVKVMDFSKQDELYFDKKNNVRYCDAAATLNTGQSTLSYKLYFSSTGDKLVEVRQGIGGFMEEISAAHQANAPATTTPASPVPSSDPTASPTEGSLRTYTNAKYGYSATYQADLLVAEPEAPNGDGRTLHSKDQSAVVRVFAEYNATDKTPEDLEKDGAKDCINPSAIMAQAEPTLVNVICENPGATIHYTRIIIKDDLLITMDAVYPKPDQLIWNPVIGRLALSLKAGQ